MKTHFTYLLISFIILIVSCSSNKSAIIGKWQKVNSEISQENEIIIIGGGSRNSSSIETVLTFNKNNTVFVKQGDNEYNANFVLHPDLLVLGNRQYELIKLDSDSLVVKEKSVFSFDENIDRYYCIK